MAEATMASEHPDDAVNVKLNLRNKNLQAGSVRSTISARW
jgi:hypothetical protein